MTFTTTDSQFHFDIDASVIFQLGEGLISDEIQSIIELTKNSYDADATYAKITVDTKRTNIEQAYYNNVEGYILIEDNGFGMDLSTIRESWLTVSFSMKREMKKNKQTTKRGRTPLGEKGLGRLSTQKLGYNLEIFTRPEDSNVEYHIAFSWRDFREAKTLTQVPVFFEEIAPTRKKGTTLIISDLKNSDVWTPNAISTLESSLSAMLSPYKEIQDFIVIAVVDGKQLELLEITNQFRQLAQLHYRLEFDGHTFQVNGKVKLDFFKPDQGSFENKALFQLLVESDSGDALVEFLNKQPQSKSFNIRRSSEEGWFIEYEYRRNFSSFDKLKMIEGELANPGPFYAEIEAFDLGAETGAHQNIFNRASDYRKYVKTISGVRIYRDGFRIRVDRDWLELAGQWTGAGSYYSLKPDNTLGYVALSARDNVNLEETTDREGFKVTPYYENFYEMFTQFVRFSAGAQEFLRRGWLAFRDNHQHKLAGIKEDATPEKLSKVINESLSKAKTFETALRELKSTLQNSTRDTQHSLKGLEQSLPQKTLDQWRAEQAVENLGQKLDDAQQVITDMQGYTQELSLREAESEVLRNQLDTLRVQLNQAYETVSLGLTAEALSHELHTIADQLAYRNQQIIEHLKKLGLKDSKLISYTEYIKTAVNAIRKQLSHLAPSLRYVREKREKINVIDFLKETKDFYYPRLIAENIELQLNLSKADNFILYMNKGKLVQIFDNLILNSEYWLREDVRLGRIKTGIISIEVLKPFIRVSDNGRGIEASVEASLFEPFVSMKGQGKGRGLGLFIVRQLLDTEGCTISLLPVRNLHNCLYIFELNFLGGLSDTK